MSAALWQDIGIAAAIAFTFLLAGPFLLLVTCPWMCRRVRSARTKKGQRQ